VKVRSVIAVLVAVALVALLTFGLLSKGNSRLAVGDSAPSPTLPCRDEAPTLQKFQSEHGGKTFTVVGIDTQDLSDDGTKFAKEFGLTYPQLHDGNGDNGHEFGTTGVPENYLLEPNGKLAWDIPGPVDTKILSEHVAPLLPTAAKES
jgi:hypothetical protein